MMWRSARSVHCSAVCLKQEVCMGFSYSDEASTCTTLQGSLSDVLLAAKKDYGHNIFWKAADNHQSFVKQGKKAYAYFSSEVSIGEARQACKDLLGSIVLPQILPESEMFCTLNSAMPFFLKESLSTRWNESGPVEFEMWVFTKLDIMF
ncbi:hypothetical protein O3P69_009022 [Scylla paramamosain]|uniref:Apple domain-containing protein n=1 Tax=Scylla paramamosain TaxID=85552 RepID=A0AAW0TTW6_SCYPA